MRIKDRLNQVLWKLENDRTLLRVDPGRPQEIRGGVPHDIRRIDQARNTLLGAAYRRASDGQVYQEMFSTISTTIARSYLTITML